jgi:hypothetical protein
MRRGQVVSPSSTPGIIIGAAAVAVSSVASSGVVPEPFASFVAVAGLVLAGLVGASLPAFEFSKGNAVLQGTALTVLTSILGVFETLRAPLLELVPANFDFIVGAVGALLAVLVGKSVPALGSVERGPQP